MKTSSQLLLTFLLNAVWQIALVAALASFSAWLLRNSAARYLHWVWVSALLLSIGIPVITASRVLRESPGTISATEIPRANELTIEPLIPVEGSVSQTLPSTDVFLLSPMVGLILLGVCFGVVIYSSFRLCKAWLVTGRLRRSAVDLVSDKRVAGVVQLCTEALETDQRIRVCSSDHVPVPITIGVVTPMIILPDELLGDPSDELLTSAIGHELIHVRRRDYALNLIYEFLYLPLSFHPAAALIRRRIRQTRELSCDELVAERILNADVYARSLVQLASSAPTLGRLSVTTTVGIADADILEARIMSLLKKSKMDTRRKRMILIAVSLLLLIPCLGAASFAMKFDLKPTETTMAVQEPSQQQKQRADEEKVMTMRARTGSSEERENELRMETDPKYREEVIAKQELEFKMRAVRQAALVKVARINMDQAIQIATSQKPGKVLQCSLDAEHWKEPGVLAEDGLVFYRVILVANDEVETGAVTHVWVNAVDGSVIRTEKELPRKVRLPE